MDDKNYFQSNQFVCPVDGSYYFLLNLGKYKDDNLDVHLKHGDRTVFRLADMQRSNKWNMISNSAVIRCLKGKYFMCNNQFNEVGFPVNIIGY